MRMVGFRAMMKNPKKRGRFIEIGEICREGRETVLFMKANDATS